MLARSSIAGLAAAFALSLPGVTGTPHYTLESTGAVRISAGGADATYGVSPAADGGPPILAIALGAVQGDAALLLHTQADRKLVPGRYRVALEPPRGPTDRLFHPCFIPGSSEKPLGFFMGEQGWVTVTAVGEDGRISGSYEMRARGFLASNPKDESRWVTVRGTFAAVADSSVAGSEAVSVIR